MGGDDGWGSGLWKQVQQVKVTRDGGIQAPASADGQHGIVVGDPPLAPLGPAPTGKQGLLRRLKLRLARG